MTVKYHIPTPYGIVRRTTKGAVKARYSHVVVYGENVGVAGGSGWIPTFHGREDLAKAKADAYGPTAVVIPIEENDVTITVGRKNWLG